jgi:hypothetical protein
LLEVSQASPNVLSGVSGVEVKKIEWYEAVAGYRGWRVLIYFLILKCIHWKENLVIRSENGLDLMDLKSERMHKEANLDVRNNCLGV